MTSSSRMCGREFCHRTSWDPRAVRPNAPVLRRSSGPGGRGGSLPGADPVDTVVASW